MFQRNRNKRIYIAGPMRGCVLRNYPLFDAAAISITDEGHVPLNPADRARSLFGIHSDDDLTEEKLAKALMEDLRELLGCDAIVMLPKWGESVGARLEFDVARLTGKRVFYCAPGYGSQTLDLNLEDWRK